MKSNITYGQELVQRHLLEMAYQSYKRQKPIKIIDGYLIVSDKPYQGFDNEPELGYPAERFWCRSITVERISDGRRGWSIGPQNEAYAGAVKNAEKKYE